MAKSQKEINQNISRISQELTSKTQAELDRITDVQSPSNMPEILSLANLLATLTKELASSYKATEEENREQNQMAVAGEVNSDNNINTLSPD